MSGYGGVCCNGLAPFHFYRVSGDGGSVTFRKFVLRKRAASIALAAAVSVALPVTAVNVTQNGSNGANGSTGASGNPGGTGGTGVAGQNVTADATSTDASNTANATGG